ncbi:MAG: hypothetical protein K6A31_07205 [Fibrobacter sp.]|jgi:hypothetical protein|nr:hypothetical protein [Fibrobacter sp.]
MIELNLIDAVTQSATIPSMPVTPAAVSTSKKNKRPLMIAAAAAVVIVLLFGILKVAGVPHALEGVLPAPLVAALGIEDPSRTGPAMESRSAGQTTTAGGTIASRRAEEQAAAVRRAQLSSPERVVQAVQPSIFPTEKRGDYASKLPMQKVFYQKAMAAQVFTFVNAVTPEGISFADLMYAAPNYYFIRGVAETPVIQRSYLERLKMGSTEFKTPELPENAPATAVTVYGVLNSKPESTNGAAPFVKDAEVAKEIEALRGLDANNRLQLSGLKHPKVEDFGVYKSYTYNVTTRADFQTVLGFVDALSKSQVRVGVEKIKMTAAGKKGISTTMTLVIYTSN